MELTEVNMPKQLSNPVSLVVTVEFDGGVHIEESKVDYGVNYSEYPDDRHQRLTCPIVYTPAQEAVILQFMADVVRPQIPV